MYVPGGAAGKAGDGKDGPNLLLHVGWSSSLDLLSSTLKYMF